LLILIVAELSTAPRGDELVEYVRAPIREQELWLMLYRMDVLGNADIDARMVVSFD
jgi:hypothetical protein